MTTSAPYVESLWETSWTNPVGYIEDQGDQERFLESKPKTIKEIPFGSQIQLPEIFKKGLYRRDPGP